jgi:hypothetical protein
MQGIPITKGPDSGPTFAKKTMYPTDPFFRWQNSTVLVISDFMLTIEGLIHRTLENEIERRTPSKSKYQDRYSYLPNRGSIHTENSHNRVANWGSR